MTTSRYDIWDTPERETVEKDSEKSILHNLKYVMKMGTFLGETKQIPTGETAFPFAWKLLH